jgi:parallel beta-helix repeat protein
MKCFIVFPEDRKMRRLPCVLALLAIIAPCMAETIIVDPNNLKDFTSIQDAIDYSWDGDTIIVNPSTYNEAVTFNGRAVTLTSTTPDDPCVVASTIITASTGPAVIFDFSEGTNSVITGFTITGYGSTGNGNGIYCNATSPTITKNIIRDCDYSGIVGTSNASPTISSNKIINNGSGVGNASFACGIYNCDGLIYNNIISGNSNISRDGGGLTSCNGIIANNIISQNSTSDDGGGVAHCNGTIINNTIAGNSADDGGGLYECDGVIKNNIIAYNTADFSGGGIYNDSPCGDNSYNGFWENENSHFGGDATAGTGDFVRDPLHAGDSDYHLKSAAGRYDPNTETWVLDDVNSPCIDAGDPCDTIGVEPNPNGGRINIGAYGGTAEASKSPSGIIEPVCLEYPAMDFDKDCKVNGNDFAMFAIEWLDCNLDPPEACWE